MARRPPAEPAPGPGQRGSAPPATGLDLRTAPALAELPVRPGPGLPPEPRYRELLARHPVLALIGNTPLVRIDLFREELPGVEIWAKAEFLNPGGSLKDRPVLRMLAEAWLAGALAGRTVIDSSSGNAGIAYAMIGGLLGVAIELVVPGNASAERQQRIVAHGAQLRLTDPLLGYDEALREAHRRAAAEPDRYYLADQYANPHNWLAHYHGTAAEILAQTGGELTDFVAGVGTGGTITGCGRRLKEHDPRIEVSCVRPESFPGIEGLKPLGAPGDIVPAILDQGVIDRWIEVRSEDARAVCRALARQGLFVGLSSGAYLYAAREVARLRGRGRIVTLLNDTGERYFSTRLWQT
ncbi:MAG: cysteine synthase [Planctomycetota bacterium]|nr:MAG: cysteine synthase [Planctomycetota bacterium]